MWEWGPARVVNSRQTQIHVCIFVFWHYRNNSLTEMHRCLCIEREPFQGYSTQLISVCWELCDYVFSSSLSLCLSLFCVCVCFLRARSGMSVENRLFKVGLPCTLSRGRDGPSKIFLPLANTLVVTFFFYHISYLHFLCLSGHLFVFLFQPALLTEDQ